ncbi:MAG: hypothetical protein ACON5H_05070 [Akkermansiaceae bacterium]
MIKKNALVKLVRSFGMVSDPLDSFPNSIAQLPGADPRTYNLAKEEYKQAHDLYKEMKLQQQEQRIILRNYSPVTIHERAK